MHDEPPTPEPDQPTLPEAERPAHAVAAWAEGWWPRAHRHTPGRWTFLAALLVVVLISALACALTVAIFAT